MYLSKSGLAKVVRTLKLSFASKSVFTQRPRDETVFECVIVDEYSGMIVLHITGPTAWNLFCYESGGHRWQRLSKGRTHSSTVTVAVFRDVPASEFTLRPAELQITTCRGSGPGGQHRNKTDSAVQVKHLPTGLLVRCETERSQQQNKASAIALLTSRLAAQKAAKSAQSVSQDRRQQIGTGERSDKIRTIQTQNGHVVNHLNDKKIPIERYLKGGLAEIL